MEITVADWVGKLNHLLSQANYDRHMLNVTLDKLIVALHYKSENSLEKKNVLQAVTNCCVAVPFTNALLVAKCSNLIYNVEYRQKINFENGQLSIIVPWLCKALQNSADIAYLDILQVLNIIIKNHPAYFTKESDELLKILLLNIEDKTTISNPIDIKLLRLSCLKSLIVYTSKNKQTQIAKEFLDTVYNLKTDELDSHAKVWTTVIEGLDFLCPKSQEWLAKYLNEVIGVVVTASDLGCDGIIPKPPIPSSPSSVIVPPQIYPTAGEVKAKAKVTLHIKKTSKVKQVNWGNGPNGSQGDEGNDTSLRANLELYNNTRWPLSESDQSDSEVGDAIRLTKLQARTRHAAFNLLIQIVKVIGCRPLYGYYAMLISKLIGSVRRENLNNPKIAALAAIAALLSGSKPFLAQAQYREGGSFTTFSESLSELISNLHTILGHSLKSCVQLPMIYHLLHTISALISVSPYQRLMPSLLTSIFRVVQPHTISKDPAVCLGVLLCLLEIVILNPISDEQKDILTAGATIAENDPCWIFTYSLNIINDLNSNENMKTGAWQLLSGLCQCHYELIRSKVNVLEEHIIKDLSELNDSKYQYHVAKTLDYLLVKLLYDDEMSTYRKELWIKLFKGPFIPLAQSSTKIASLACDCLSSMGHHVYHSLMQDVQILVIMLIYGCCCNELSTVRASAINTLGMFLLFPQVIDEQFVIDTKDILINALEDGNDLVRSKAAWAFGNLIELVISNQDKEFIEEISLIKLLNAGLSVVKDNQKVKGNILRAVGNLTLLITSDDLTKVEFRDAVNKSADFFLSCATTGTLMKMRWNACYAIGTMLKNEALYGPHNNWLGNIINSLCALLLKCNNFKVRVNACIALCSIKRREHFGIYYHHVLNSLLDGLDNAANMSDFREFKHQDNLKQQLCLGICHMVLVLKEEDIGELEETMNYRLDSLRQNMVLFLNCAPPEKTGMVLEAANHISYLISTSTSNQRCFLNIFYKSFEVVYSTDSTI